jgi:hypothetical protein
MSDIKEITDQPYCDRAFEHNGKIYAARKYDWWYNGTVKRNVIAIYERPGGHRVIVEESHSWDKAIKRLRKYLGL